MIYLLGSIVLTSWLTLAFKIVERFGLSPLQVIVFNYCFTVITGSILNGRINNYAADTQQDWFFWACLMGTVFIILFNIIAFTAQRIGVAVTSVANKLSLVIPFIFSIYLYNENATWLKILGIIVALIAVVLTCLPSKKQKDQQRNRWLYIMPVLLFLGSGLLDTMIKYVEHHFLNAENVNEYLITAFTMAAILGIVSLGIQFLSGRDKFSWRAVVMGVCIGIPNYFSIWCLMEVLKQYSDNSSAIIPINNMGIVLFSAVVAWLAFTERLSAQNWIGIILSLGAIALIAYG
jgi:drug/metabolite transporter (DMT)-like permease